MAEEELQFNVASMVEDVLQQHGKRLSDIDLASRKAQEASLRRYEAAGWLRKMVGVVLGRDLPAEPSEDDFRLGLRSGIILCNALNKVQLGAMPKIVEAPSDTAIVPDGAALCAYQYFENIRNFLVAIEKMGIPTFEVSDLEKGGESSRIVNCILALKSYHDWKQCGGHGLWKFSGNSKPPSTDKQIIRKNSDLFMGFLSRCSSASDSLSNEQNSCGGAVQDPAEVGASHNLHTVIRELLSDKNREDIPVIVERMLSKVMEEFEHRLAGQNEEIRKVPHDKGVPSSYKTGETEANFMKNGSRLEQNFYHGEPKGHSWKHHDLVEYQQRSIQELKNVLHSAKEDMQVLRMKYQEQAENLGKHLNSLAHAAYGYRKVLEENRKLYNQVQDLKGNIRVYCRVRPFLPGNPSRSSTVEDIDESTLTILAPSKHGRGKKSFTFNKAFGPSASQEEVFADTQPLIRSVLDGYNVCIFAYGQTGSGKTYTMTGPKELTKESLGVNYRALNDLFLISEDRKDTVSYDISVQMIEIYNEQVRDLLVTDGLNKKLEIRNNSLNGINVPDANLAPVTSTSDVINLMNLGHKNRAVGSTSMNDRSSRSHSCLTVRVQGRDLTSGAVLRGCMHLVDLAGSERVDKTEATGDRLKEAQHINRSLSALGDVVSSLAQKHSHVPYRNSKLTQLLQDSLGGQAKTLMFVHISPEPDALGETISTLKFAQRVSTVELGAARANKESSNVKELKEQIATLKAALAQKEGEWVPLPHSTSSRADTGVVASSGSSPSHSSWNDIGDSCKAEDGSNSSSTSRRHSLDPQDLLANSPSWPSLSTSPELMKEVKCVSGRQSPETLYRNRTRGTSKVYPEQSLNKISPSRRHSLDTGLARTKYEMVTTDDLDELEAETSDSSEPDHQQQLFHRSSSMPNVVEPKVRRPSPKPAKNQEMRSLIPQPTRRVSNGVHSTLNKSGRQQSSVVGRQKPARGK